MHSSMPYLNNGSGIAHEEGSQIRTVLGFALFYTMAMADLDERCPKTPYPLKTERRDLSAIRMRCRLLHATIIKEDMKINKTFRRALHVG